MDRLVKYTARLAEVRQRRLAMAAALAAAEADAAAEAAAAAPEDDLVSESPSMLSGFSMYTEATGLGTAAGGSSSSSSGLSSRAPSTVGGRRAQRRENKAARKAGKTGKIRAGSPGEEMALAAHLATLAPAQHVLQEAGQLAELLVLLQHVDDAAKLQQRVGQWQAAATAAMLEVNKGQQPQQQQQTEAGIGTSGAQQQQQQQQQPPSQGQAAAQAAPQQTTVSWKWDVLREHK